MSRRAATPPRSSSSELSAPIASARRPAALATIAPSGRRRFRPARRWPRTCSRRNRRSSGSDAAAVPARKIDRSPPFRKAERQHHVVDQDAEIGVDGRPLRLLADETAARTGRFLRPGDDAQLRLIELLLDRLAPAASRAGYPDPTERRAPRSAGRDQRRDPPCGPRSCRRRRCSAPSRPRSAQLPVLALSGQGRSLSAPK